MIKPGDIFTVCGSGIACTAYENCCVSRSSFDLVLKKDDLVLKKDSVLMCISRVECTCKDPTCDVVLFLTDGGIIAEHFKNATESWDKEWHSRVSEVK